MTELETRTIKMIVAPKGEPIFCERATEIEIADEAAGEFVKVIQSGDDAENGTIQIDPAEWPKLRSAIDLMIKKCR